MMGRCQPELWAEPGLYPDGARGPYPSGNRTPQKAGVPVGGGSEAIADRRRYRGPIEAVCCSTMSAAIAKRQ